MKACWVVVLAMASAAVADVGMGDSREAVLELHGRPASTAKRGNHEILLYPNGGRIELLDGKVANVKGPLPVTTLGSPAETAGKPSAGSGAASPGGSAATPGKAKPIPPQPLRQSAGSAGAADPNAELHPAGEKPERPAGAADLENDEDAAVAMFLLLVGSVVLRFGLTLVALKLAFKYAEMDAFWKGILAIAGIDLAVHISLQALGPLTAGLTTQRPVDYGITVLVLVYTIHRFCFNKRLPNAVLTAFVVKTIVTLLHAFVGLAALTALLT